MMARQLGSDKLDFMMSLRLFLVMTPLVLFACSDDSPGGGGSGGSGGNGGAGGSGASGASGGAGAGTTEGGGGEAPTDGGGGAGPSDGGGGASEGGAGGGPCVPITEDASQIGDDCGDNLPECGDGYTCWAMSGVAFQQLCAILCEEDCECPEGTSCETRNDKNMTWTECVPIN